MHAPVPLGASQVRSAVRAASGGATLLCVGAIYWLSVYPQVRRELEGWERRARAVPDPVLRRHALAKLTGERLNPEAAALFAVLAPRRARRSVVRLIVAYQVLYDYLDGVNEERGSTPLVNGLRLHRALTEALTPGSSLSDYYASNPWRQDGGYTRTLVSACRRIASTLPALGVTGEVIMQAADRCGEAQSQNHAIVERGDSDLVAWSLAHRDEANEYLWWELAAAGISCLSIHALLASAADRRATRGEVARVDEAYFPSICALSALLDSLADYHGDAGTSNHSFVAHYRDSGHAGERLVAITAEAARRVRSLRRGRRHEVILAGICGYYLSCRSVEEGFPSDAAHTLVGHIGAVGVAMRGVLRLRRRAHQRWLSERPGS